MGNVSCLSVKAAASDEQLWFGWQAVLQVVDCRLVGQTTLIKQKDFAGQEEQRHSQNKLKVGHLMPCKCCLTTEAMTF